MIFLTMFAGLALVALLLTSALIADDAIGAERSINSSWRVFTRDAKNPTNLSPAARRWQRDIIASSNDEGRWRELTTALNTLERQAGLATTEPPVESDVDWVHEILERLEAAVPNRREP